MPKFIIKWNAGYGESALVVEAETLEEANHDAYAAWREEAESNADYSAEPWTRDEAEAYGLLTEEEEKA